MSFPKSEQRLAYETFVNILQTNPLLKRELRTFLYWGGSAADSTPPSTANVPYVRLTFNPSTSRRDRGSHVDTQSQSADILIDVLAAMPGSNEGDLVDLWDAITRAIYPRDTDMSDAIDQRLKDVGITDVDLYKPAIKVQPSGGKDGLYLEGTGQIRLEFYEQLKFDA